MTVIDKQLTPISGSGLAPHRDGPVVALPYGVRRELNQRATELRYQELCAILVTAAISRVHAHVVEMALNTMAQIVLQLEQASFLPEAEREQINLAQANYLARMIGISDYTAFQLVRLLQQAPDLPARQGMLDALRDWFLSG
jgi:hypothetical protein